VEERLFPVDDVKRCCTCKQIKPLSEFNRMTRSKDGRQGSCRECNKAYHYAHWDRHMAQINARNRRMRRENRQRMVNLLRQSRCADCGEDDIVVLEFDHLRDKRWNIGAMISRNCEWARILEEIAKCEVVCANCHRRRTARRANSYRHRAVTED
jgi:hypothetical protein